MTLEMLADQTTVLVIHLLFIMRATLILVVS